MPSRLEGPALTRDARAAASRRGSSAGRTRDHRASRLQCAVARETARRVPGSRARLPDAVARETARGVQGSRAPLPGRWRGACREVEGGGPEWFIKAEVYADPRWAGKGGWPGGLRRRNLIAGVPERASQPS